MCFQDFYLYIFLRSDFKENKKITKIKNDRILEWYMIKINVEEKQKINKQVFKNDQIKWSDFREKLFLSNLRWRA